MRRPNYDRSHRHYVGPERHVYRQADLLRTRNRIRRHGSNAVCPRRAADPAGQESNARRRGEDGRGRSSADTHVSTV